MKNKRILIFCPNWIGDVLFSTPVIKAIRHNQPQAHIACAVVPGCRDVLEDNPCLNEIIIYDQDGEHKSLLGKMRFISILRQKEFDEVYILRHSLTRTLITALSKIKVRVGFSQKQNDILLTHSVNLNDKHCHRCEMYLQLCRRMQMEAPDRNYEFFVRQKDREYINQLLESESVKKDDLFIVLNPGGNWEPKRWPKENFVKLADALIEKYKAKVCISGSEKDLKLAQQITEAMSVKPVVACGRTDIKQLGALMERADIVISADSGPLHIASAVGSDVIAIFGPTSPAITGPCGKGRHIIIHKDVGCRIPCYKPNCQSYKCMKSIEPSDILAAVGELLNR